ncbi:hypothetical protein AB0L34_32165, partial [Micromonospora sp. NPDC052213]
GSADPQRPASAPPLIGSWGRRADYGRSASSPAPQTVTDAVPLANRAKTQGMMDVSIAVADATGGLASGLVVSAAGCPVLALVGGLVSLAVLPAITATTRSR